MSGRASADEEAVAFDELAEGVADGVSGAADADGLHHARVAQLAAAQVAIEEFGLLQFVGLDAAHEERLAGAERAHQRVQRALELGRQRRRPLARLRAHADVLGEQRPQELVARHVHLLHQVGAERVAVLVQKAWVVQTNIPRSSPSGRPYSSFHVECNELEEC